MLNINDKLFVSLKIDGQEFQYGNLVSIVATEGNGALVPAIKIQLSDPTSALSSAEKALTEGNEIELLVATSFKDNKVRPRKYRIFSPNRSNQAFNPTVAMVGILDAPGYITESVRESYSGTSEEVLKSVAGKCGLKFSGQSSIDGRTPNDSQKWLNVCRNRATFIKDVVTHGWIDPYSGMSAAVTSYGELKYRDLIALINTPIDKIQFVFSHNSLPSSSDTLKKSYLVKEARDRSSAGIMSAWQNYGSTRAQNMLSGTPEKFKELQVKMPGKYLPINKEVADKVERARIEYAPLDCGNVHQRYEEAQYQNIKLSALFSEKMSLLITEVTEVSLYDVVIYRQEDADLSQPVKNTDVYIVVGKTIAVSGGAHYAERIELARMSLTMKGSTELELPSTSSSEKSMIPDVRINPSSIGSLFAGNRSTISSLSSLLNSVNNGNLLLETARSPLLNTLNNVLDSIVAASGNILNGAITPQTTQALLSSSLMMLSSLKEVEELIRYTGSQNTDLCAVTKELSPIARNTVMSQSGSITTSLVNQYSLALPSQAIASALLNVVNMMTTAEQPMTAQDYGPVYANAQQAVSTANMCTAQVNTGWNSTLSTFRGIEQPNTYTEGPSTISNAVVQAMSSSTSDDAFLNTLHLALKNDYSTSPNWQHPYGMSPIAASYNLDKTLKLAATYVRRLSENT